MVIYRYPPLFCNTKWSTKIVKPHKVKIGVKNEVGFKCQRSLLQVPMKPASMPNEAGFIFLRYFPLVV